MNDFHIAVGRALKKELRGYDTFVRLTSVVVNNVDPKTTTVKDYSDHIKNISDKIAKFECTRLSHQETHEKSLSDYLNKPDYKMAAKITRSSALALKLGGHIVELTDMLDKLIIAKDKKMESNNPYAEVYNTLLSFSHDSIMAKTLDHQVGTLYASHDAHMKVVKEQVEKWEADPNPAISFVHLDMNSIHYTIGLKRESAITLIGEEALLRAGCKSNDPNAVFLIGPRAYPVGYFEQHLQFYRTAINDLQKMYDRLGVVSNPNSYGDKHE